MSRRAVAILVPLAVGAVLLAGCGSSAPTKAQYTAKANAICASASSKTAPLIMQLAAAAGSLSSSSGQTAARQLTGVLHQLHTTATTTLAQLRALKQPTSDHLQIARFLTPFASTTAALDQAAKAADAGQSEQALAELKKVAPDVKQMTIAARTYGLTTCQNVLAAAP